MNLRFWKVPESSAPRQVEIVRRNSLKLRLSEWRSDPKLVTEAQRLISLETFQCMLDVLRNESPANFVLGIGAAAHERTVQQCRGEGYMMALANLESMGNLSHPSEVLEPTFEPEEIEKKK